MNARGCGASVPRAGESLKTLRYSQALFAGFAVVLLSAPMLASAEQAADGLKKEEKATTTATSKLMAREISWTRDPNRPLYTGPMPGQKKPAESALQVRVESYKTEYNQNEFVEVAVDLTQPAYLFVFMRDTEGDSRQIYPNAAHPEPVVESGIWYIPGQDDTFNIQVSGKPGEYQITAVAVPTELGEKLRGTLQEFSKVDVSRGAAYRKGQRLLDQLSKQYGSKPGTAEPWSVSSIQFVLK